MAAGKRRYSLHDSNSAYLKHLFRQFAVKHCVPPQPSATTMTWSRAAIFIAITLATVHGQNCWTTVGAVSRQYGGYLGLVPISIPMSDSTSSAFLPNTLA